MGYINTKINAITQKASWLGALSVLISVWLAWRLLRMNDFLYEFWYLYIYVLVSMVALSSFVNLRYIGGGLHNIRCVSSVKDYQASFLFVIFLLFVFLFQMAMNRNADTFTVASLVFFLYFPLVKTLQELKPLTFFKIFETVIIFLALVNLVDIYNIATNAGIFNYDSVYEIRGEDASMPALNSENPFFDFRGRPPGVSGTPYASSALMGAATLYFLITRSWWKMAITGFTSLLFATGSTILITMVAFFFAGPKRVNNLVILPAVIFFGLEVLFERIGENFIAWVPRFGFDGNLLQLIYILFLGEGKHLPSVTVGEFRILFLPFSLGLIGLFALVGLFLSFKKGLRIFRPKRWFLEYKGAFWFLVVLFLSGWHYHTFMVFPNIVFVVAIIAFAAAQMKNRYIRGM